MHRRRRSAPADWLGVFGAAAFSLVVSLVLPAHAAEPDWLKLQTPRFGVVSQLGPESTERWAREFDRFIEAIQQLFGANDLTLPPLTIVLFENTRAFRPYLPNLQANRDEIAGFFGNQGTWSTIGLAGRSASAVTRRIVLHEAVHWLMSANEVELPVWLEEGLAEVYSTFEVDGGNGRWGMPIEDHVNYLNQVGLLPLEEFFRISRTEVHGSNRFYPQAWAVVHYLLFGDGGAHRRKLAEYLAQLRQADLETAFTTAFDSSFEDVQKELRSYVRSGRYSYSQVEFTGGVLPLETAPATPANVEVSLARLAIAGGNLELAKRHAEELIDLLPTAAVGYDVLALTAASAGDAAALGAALDRAIELDSSDATVYSLKANELLRTHTIKDASIVELLPPETARAVADLLHRSITLWPGDRGAYERLALALLNVDVATEQDDAGLALGRRVFPTAGFVLVGQAAVERARGNTTEAARLLRQSRVGPMTLPARYRAAIDGVHDYWLMDWLRGELERLTADERFADAHALLGAQLADQTLTDRPRSAIEALDAELTGFEQAHDAYLALRAGRRDEARAILERIVNDSTTTARVRRNAERWLEQWFAN
jgi:hypothetical protein